MGLRCLEGELHLLWEAVTDSDWWWLDRDLPPGDLKANKIFEKPSWDEHSDPLIHTLITSEKQSQESQDDFAKSILFRSTYLFICMEYKNQMTEQPIK